MSNPENYNSIDANLVIRQLANQLAEKEIQIAMLKTQLSALSGPQVQDQRKEGKGQADK